MNSAVHFNLAGDGAETCSDWSRGSITIRTTSWGLTRNGTATAW